MNTEPADEATDPPQQEEELLPEARYMWAFLRPPEQRYSIVDGMFLHH